MANNIEIKARAGAFANQRQLAGKLTDIAPLSLAQCDTFFNVPQGRLKLREFDDAPAQLIYYQRIDKTGPTLSDYHITELVDAAGIKSVLSKAYGVRQVVRKHRELFLVGRTRIHFDTVDQLGEFIELEVVLAEDDSIENAHAEAQQLMKQLNIQLEQLIDVAYVDLLELAA